MMFSTFAAVVVVVVVVAVVTGLIVLFWFAVSWLNSLAPVWKTIRVLVQFFEITGDKCLAVFLFTFSL